MVDEHNNLYDQDLGPGLPWNALRVGSELEEPTNMSYDPEIHQEGVTNAVVVVLALVLAIGLGFLVSL
mgnify:CR=1 FL=1